MLSRWGNDAGEFRIPSCKMLMTFLLTMRATPIFYNGDELGMANIKFESIKDYRDIETLTMYQYLKSLDKEEEIEQFIKDQQFSARDNSRTPFQWTAGEKAGFTTGEPWITLNPDHIYINEEAQDADSNSPLNYFRQLVKFRKERMELVYGKYTLYDEAHEQVYTYTRVLDKKGLLVMLNFSKELVDYAIPASLKIKNYEPLINNETSVQVEDHHLILLPYQALLFELIS
jgi:oligo-1,6-glucosidase